MNVMDEIGRIVVRGWGKKTLEVSLANKWNRMSVAIATPFQEVVALVSWVWLFTPNRRPSLALFTGLKLAP